MEKLPLLRGNMRRSRVEITFDILEVIGAGLDSPTKIMYAANMSWSVLSEELKNLREKGLIEVVSLGKRKSVRITGKGLELLKKYHEIKSIL